MAINLQDQVTREEQAIAALEKERDTRMAWTDAEIQQLKDNGESQFGQLATLQEKRENAAQFYESIINRRRDALTVKRGELAAWQKEQADMQQAEADKQERLAKTRARAAYPGTDLEFAAAWPSMWNAIRQQRTVEAARRDDIPVIRINF